MARLIPRKGWRPVLLVLVFVSVFLLFSVVRKHSSTAEKPVLTGENIGELTARYFDTHRNDRRVTDLDCRLLVQGDAKAIKQAKDVTLAPIPEQAQVDFLTYQFLTGCDNFIRRRGYITEPDDPDFSIAFSILFHDNVAQMELLLRAIYRPNNLICLHLDAKSPLSLLNVALALSNCLPNVILAKQERVVYASISRLQAELNCMQAAQAHFIPWKYYINLVGQVFPLKTNHEMIQILKIYNGSNDIEGLDRREIRSRFEFRYVVENDRIKNTSLPHAPPPHGLHIARGSAYGIFSRAFVDFVLSDQVAKDLLEWSRDTYSPDEHYWATLHHLVLNPQLQTPGGYKGDLSEKDWFATMAVWQDNPDQHCYSGHYVRGVCIYGVADLQQLTTFRTFFANKFEVDFQPLALQCMEEWHYDRTIQNPPFDTSFYKKLKFITK